MTNEKEYIQSMIKTEEDKEGYEKYGLLYFVSGRVPDDGRTGPNIVWTAKVKDENHNSCKNDLS